MNRYSFELLSGNINPDVVDKSDGIWRQARETVPRLANARLKKEKNPRKRMLELRRELSTYKCAREIVKRRIKKLLDSLRPKLKTDKRRAKRGLVIKPSKKVTLRHVKKDQRLLKLIDLVVEYILTDYLN